MIPENFIESWREHAQWQTLAQIEQDLIISRTLVDLYNNPYIQDSLVFRGGTALNKLFIKPSARYSEDIDFVQKRVEAIGQTIEAIRKSLNPWLGEPVWKITQRSAKLIYKYESINKIPGKLKIEINTTEHFQVLPFKIVEFSVNSEWFQGSSKITTYEIDELMATKLRALYQRRKGRDLFDLWYVTKQGLINIDDMLNIFSKYCASDGILISGAEFLKNLNLKRSHPDFHIDMHALLPPQLNWDFEEAYQFVLENIIKKVR
ncbi:MAG: nucleotidyl transferase AbiEii/AbiGii toxin family protein [Rickettsia endosymbiont of Oxypoda opaca]|nr:nucleotidyl transferase AbiEii/AbiGii toxin family protein [Rickettsia endosymbiont of Oxypoda opaca]